MSSAGNLNVVIQPGNIRIIESIHSVATEEEKLERAKTRIGQEIIKLEQEIEQSKREIIKLVEELNSLSLSPNYARYIQSALDILKMRKEQLMSRPDSDDELAGINEAIKALEAQLDILRGKEVGRVVKTSTIE
ncbi:hypothetical protein OPQ81_008576 [Rhizoctonia solani]|nr:hypothetical protein OPQ81_008576 [Rhizoctonia solani]